MANRHLRKRATAVIIREGKVLLVKHRGQRHFSLPGGGIKAGESVLATTARELYKELKLEANNIRRLDKCDFNTAATRHHICLVDADGEPVRRKLEVAKFIWWDMKEHIPLFPHVKETLRKVLSNPISVEV